TELLVGIEERTGALDARSRMDDLVAVHFAAAAFDLVLRPERELARARRRMLSHLHIGIVGAVVGAAQDLTSPRTAGKAPSQAASRRRAMFSTSICVKAWWSGSRPSGCSSARNQTAWTVVMPSSPAPRMAS